MVKFYDISLLINNATIVYPGNEPVSIKQYAFREKDPVNESMITTGVHAGTHIDSEFHIRNDGRKASEIPLDNFYGRCKVLDLTHIKLEIHREDLEQFEIKKGDIILLKTINSNHYDKFIKDFIHVKMDAAKFLVEIGIKTLCCDYLSVKKFGGDDEVHELIINNMTLFEGLNLSKVPQGEYIFIGLPIRLEADGAPARVILIEE